MKQALGVYLILGALAATAVSVTVPSLDTVQYDEELRLQCDLGWQLLYLDSDQANPTCIYFDVTNPTSGVEVAKQRCAAMNSWLAEPEGWLHNEIYNRIYVMGYNLEQFWIGGSDYASEGLWIWERTGKPMPMGTPHWEQCGTTQPIPNDRNSNYACIWTPKYYFFSCQNNSVIRTMCQKYPTAMKAATHQEQQTSHHQEPQIPSTKQ